MLPVPRRNAAPMPRITRSVLVKDAAHRAPTDHPDPNAAVRHIVVPAALLGRLGTVVRSRAEPVCTATRHTRAIGLPTTCRPSETSPYGDSCGKARTQPANTHTAHPACCRARCPRCGGTAHAAACSTRAHLHPAHGTPPARANRPPLSHEARRTRGRLSDRSGLHHRPSSPARAYPRHR